MGNTGSTVELFYGNFVKFGTNIGPNRVRNIVVVLLNVFWGPLPFAQGAGPTPDLATVFKTILGPSDNISTTC